MSNCSNIEHISRRRGPTVVSVHGALCCVEQPYPYRFEATDGRPANLAMLDLRVAPAGTEYSQHQELQQQHHPHGKQDLAVREAVNCAQLRPKHDTSRNPCEEPQHTDLTLPDIIASCQIHL